MLVNYYDFYLLNHQVKKIDNIQYDFVLVMDFDKIYGIHLLNDLTYEIFTNSMQRRKAMLTFVIHKDDLLFTRIIIIIFFFS